MDVRHRFFRLWGAALVACAALILAACAPLKNSPMAGTWVCTQVVYEGTTLDAAVMFDTAPAPVLTLEPTGRATLKADGDTATGTWEEFGTDVLFTDRERPYVLLFADDMLSLDVGTMICKFSPAAAQ